MCKVDNLGRAKTSPAPVEDRLSPGVLAISSLTEKVQTYVLISEEKLGDKEKALLGLLMGARPDYSL
jgi:hypothetical protein